MTDPTPKAAWHIVTGEYPPQEGGVSDYSAQVARGLSRAGDDVHVWAPTSRGRPVEEPGIQVHRLRGHFDPLSIREMMRGMDACPPPRRILLQYVAGAFGLHAMNLPFCLGILLRRADPVWVMFHEYAYPRGWRLKPAHNLLGIVTPVMAGSLAWKADRIFVSTPAWVARMPATIRKAQKHPITWLPVPSNVPVEFDPDQVSALRERLLAGGRRWVIGHFGTYGPSMVALLEDLLAVLLGPGDRSVILIGKRSDLFSEGWTGRHPGMKGLVHGTGPLPEADLAAHLKACDLLVQPYEDGVTSRRGTLMAGLALGIPVVTNHGPDGETWFSEEGAVAMAPDPSPASISPLVDALLREPERRAALGRRGLEVYGQRCSLEHTIGTLRRLAREDGA